MPPPATSSFHRRFSSTVTFRQGPHSAEALEGALRLAEPFSYSAEATHVLFNSPFLRLPDFASVIGPPRIDPSVDPVPPELSVIEWLHNRAPRLIPQRFRTFSPVPRGFVDFFNSNIHLVQVAMLLHQHLCNDEDAVAEARRHKRDFSAVVFLRCPLPGTPAVINTPPPGAPAAATNPSVTPSAIPLPDSLPNTALAPRPMLQSLPLGPTPFQPSQPSQAASFSQGRIPNGLPSPGKALRRVVSLVIWPNSLINSGCLWASERPRTTLKAKTKASAKALKKVNPRVRVLPLHRSELLPHISPLLLVRPNSRLFCLLSSGHSLTSHFLCSWPAWAYCSARHFPLPMDLFFVFTIL